MAHQYHQGISKTKALLREKVWWPQINKDIECIVKSCVACISVCGKDSTEPLSMTTMPGRWEVLHVDLYGPLPSGHSVLGVIDACSRWPELHIMTSTTSQSIQEKLELSFCQHGKPLKIVTDNAPNLRSVEIKDFCSAHGIRHRKIGPYWPKANGHIERF